MNGRKANDPPATGYDKAWHGAARLGPAGRGMTGLVTWAALPPALCRGTR